MRTYDPDGIGESLQGREPDIILVLEPRELTERERNVANLIGQILPECYRKRWENAHPAFRLDQVEAVTVSGMREDTTACYIAAAFAVIEAKEEMENE